MGFIIRIADTYQTWINLSSQQSFYRLPRVHPPHFVLYLLVLPNHLYPALSLFPAFLLWFSPILTPFCFGFLLSLLTHGTLSSYLSSRPYSLSDGLFSSSFPGCVALLCLLLSSSPFHRHTDQWQHSSSPGCLYKCYLLSWHLKARFIFGSKALGQILQCKADTIFSEFHWQTLTDLYSFFETCIKQFRKWENQEKLRTAKDIICRMMAGVPKLALVQTHTLHSAMSQDAVVARRLTQPYSFQTQTASRHVSNLCQIWSHCHKAGKLEFVT